METAGEEWFEGELIVVPHAWRGGPLWNDIQAESQGRIGSELRAMYAELLRQQLPPQLAGLVVKIDPSPEADRNGG